MNVRLGYGVQVEVGLLSSRAHRTITLQLTPRARQRGRTLAEHTVAQPRQELLQSKCR